MMLVNVEVKDGVPLYINSGELVPVEHLMYGKIPKDGVYHASEATCGGSNGCKVGEPSQHCVKRKIVSETQCAKISLNVPFKDAMMVYELQQANNMLYRTLESVRNALENNMVENALATAHEVLNNRNQ